MTPPTRGDGAEECAKAIAKRRSTGDICEVTGKHVEAASPSDRICQCETCQAYLRRIIDETKRRPTR